MRGFILGAEGTLLRKVVGSIMNLEGQKEVIRFPWMLAPLNYPPPSQTDRNQHCLKKQIWNYGKGNFGYVLPFCRSLWCPASEIFPTYGLVTSG